MNTYSNLLKLARQGDINAIETILNQQVKAKNITAKVAFKDSCLQVMLMSEQVPAQQLIAAFIRETITNLGIQSLERLKLYGKQIGDDFPAWNQEFELLGKPNLMPSTSTTEKVSIYKADTINSLQPNLQNAKKIFERFSILNQHQLIGIGGVICLFIGLFIPVKSTAVGYSLSRASFFDSVIVMPYDELIIIPLAIVSLVLILENNKQKWLLGSGLACFCFTLVGFIKTFQQELSFDETIVLSNKTLTFDIELITLGWLFLFISSEFIILSSFNNLPKNKLTTEEEKMRILSLCTILTLVSMITIVILCL